MVFVLSIWKYTCFDMYGALTGKIPTGTNFVLTKAQVFLDDPEVLFDEVTIGRQQTLNEADMCKYLSLKCSTCTCEKSFKHIMRWHR